MYVTENYEVNELVLGKRKGNSFENKILGDLRDTFGYECAHKTKGSGNAEDDRGDIIFKERYIIECKHHKDMPWSKLTHIWNKLKKECEQMDLLMKAKPEPVVIYRVNRQPIMVLTYVYIKERKTRGVICYDVWKQVM